MDKTDRLRDYGLAFLLYEQGLGICGYELIRELFIFTKLILNSYLNILNMFKDYLYSEKNSKMLLMAFANEHDKIIKFLQAYILVLERPKDWNIYIDKYISELGANTYYLGQLKDIMLLHLGHNEIKEEDEPRLKNLIKKAAYKLSTGKNVNSIQELNSICITKEKSSDDVKNDNNDNNLSD